MSTCAELAVMLTEARAALHGLQIGGLVKTRQFGDKRIEYSAGNIGDLRAYVASLQAQVDACNGVARPGRAIHFMPVDC